MLFKEDQSLHLLRASVPVGGRSLTLYEEVHPPAALRQSAGAASVPAAPGGKELQQVVRDAELGRRYADKLAKVYTRDGAET